MTLSRTFILRTKVQEEALSAFLRSNAEQMAAQGRPLEVSVREWKPRASDAQRALIWIVNQQIADQAWVGGKQFSAETWHEHCKRAHLPDKTSRGVEKWRYLPTGERVLNMSTEHLDRSEKTAYIEALMAFAASLGVEVEILASENE